MVPFLCEKCNKFVTSTGSLKEKETHTTASKPKRFRAVRIIGRIILGILVVLFLLLLFLRSSWGQNIIVGKITTYISNKTHTKVDIGHLFLGFDGHLHLKHLFLEDQKGDTLIYSNSLEANLPLWDMIRGKNVGVDALQWDGLRANIIRKDSVYGYNFQFLIDAFTSENPGTEPTEPSDTPLQLVIGKLEFKNIDIVYDDAIAGIDSRFTIGSFQTAMKTVNLDQMIFEAATIELANSHIKVMQTPTDNTPDEASETLPFLGVDDLKLTDVSVNYQSPDADLSAHMDITEFFAKIPKIDLTNNDFNVETVQLNRSTIALQMETGTTIATPESTSQNNNFEWPEMQIAVGSITLDDNKFSVFTTTETSSTKGFNPKVLVFTQLGFHAHTIQLKDQTAQLNLENFVFEEGSGLELHNLSFKLEADDQSLTIANLQTNLNNSHLQAHIHVDYPSVAAFINNPENSKIDLDIPDIQVELNDIFHLQPELKQNPYLSELSTYPLYGSVKANGHLSDITIAQLTAHWHQTQLSAFGKVQNATHPDLLEFDMMQITAASKRRDLTKFVDDHALGIHLPDDVELTGTVTGSLTDIRTNVHLSTTQGTVTLDGYFKNQNTIAFDSKLGITNYNLAELLQNDQLGNLSVQMAAAGEGNNINNLNAKIETDISNFTYNDYQIQGLNLVGDIKNGQGNIESRYKDYNLDMELLTTVVLDSLAPEVDVQLDIIGADLHALGLLDKEIKTAMKIYGTFKGNSEAYDISTTINDGVMVYDNRSYLMGELAAAAHVTKDTTAISVKHQLIDAVLQSNTDPNTFSKAIKQHVISYFNRQEQLTDSLEKPVNVILKGKLIQAPILKDVFLVNVKELDTVTFDVDFRERHRQLKADITAPHINFSGFVLDSLAFTMDTDKQKFGFDLGFNRFNAGPVDIPKTRLTGNQSDNALVLALQAYHKNTILTQMTGTITGNNEQLRFHVTPEDLIINTNPWHTPYDNEVLIGKKSMTFNNFHFSNANQSVEITNTLPNLDSDHIAIQFKSFKLSEFLNYLNPDKEIAGGNLNGNFILEDPFVNTGIIANLGIEQFNILQVDLGNLGLEASSLGNNSYDFHVDMNGGAIDLDLNGDYLAIPGGAQLDLDLAINQFKMKALTTWSDGEISDTDGSFSGNFKLNGTLENPEYQGHLDFNNAQFKIKMFNSAFTLTNETLYMDNHGITMDRFTIRDAQKNTLMASGNIGMESFANPTFDLNIAAKNFQVMNATKDDNNFLYGKASFDADAKITGHLYLPKIDLDAMLSSDTDITYVLPTATVNIEERDGVVTFVNRENPDDILTRTDPKKNRFSGFDLKALLKIGKDAAVTLILDQTTDDNFRVSGEGDLVINIKPNGNVSLAGIYEVTSGHYELDLYGIVNRKFKLVPGSRVSWSGDPLDAKLDIKALYELKTSASALMAPTTSNMDQATKAKYRQSLPFHVYLNIDGQLMEPQINFNLDMPKDELGAVGGQVYSRVQQLNQQEDELNRQVFSLLVLNRFYPDPGSDGSSGGVAAIARDNLNDAISDQLNMFSDKLLSDTGFELNFGLDSYTDYQGSTPEERTQLDIAAQKKLFNDRLIVSVGSEIDLQKRNPAVEDAPLIGNFSLEYLLTENGRYRLKGFHKNEYENLIDGQTIVSGIALIFTQEFNKFHELWEALTKRTTKAEKESKEKKKP